MKKKWRLSTILSLAFITVLIVVTSLMYGLILKQNSNFVQDKEEKLLLDIGQQLAIEPQIQSALLENKTNDSLESYALNIAKIHKLDFVVIMNMNAIRLTHPDTKKIGKHFEGGDEIIALNGKTHISVSQGTLGNSLRGFVPVFSAENPKKQIGVIALGIKLKSLSSLIENSREGYTLALTLSIGIGISAAFALAYFLKRQLHSLEPHEISRLFEERNAMLDETKDVIIVVDKNKTITLANISAKEMYQRINGHSNPLVGSSLSEIILNEEILDFDKRTEQLYKQNNQDYLFSTAPILVNKKQTGWIIFLRNATESLFVMDQLANTTAYASALQTQSHEFMNKLHVIYGLADLKAYDELKIYLDDILTPEKEFSNRLSFLVKNPQFAGFLIGERRKFAERKTQLIIEITPEIPENKNNTETNLTIDLYRYLHKNLLQYTLGDELTMLIHFENNKLNTTYQINIETSNQEILLQQLNSNFFNQILVESKATMTIETSIDTLRILISTNYHGSKNIIKD